MTPEKAQAAIDAYVAKQETFDPPRPILLSGIALALDVTTETLRQWRNMGDDEPPEIAGLSATIKKARQLCEHSLAVKAVNDRNCAGAIFLLKCNHDHIEKSNVRLTDGEGKPLEMAAIPEAIVKTLAAAVRDAKS